MTTLTAGAVQERGMQGAQGEHPYTNVGQTERWVTGAAGGLAVLAGVAAFAAPKRPHSIGGSTLVAVGGAMLYRAFSGHCPAYSAMGIDTAQGQGGARPEEYFNRGIHVEQAFTINASPQELYAFWKNFENLPSFMRHLESVTKIDEKRSHWVACGPAGYRVEWDAEIINDEPNELIAWRSLGNADVDNAGSVRFLPAPGDRGTQVKVVIDYIPPAGRVGAGIAKLFGKDPKTQVREDLRRFRQIVELGEVVTNEGQPRGTCMGSARAQ
jgi:uncharacterized membrane protein